MTSHNISNAPMQQINLFNPDFVPRRDLTSLPYLAGGVLVILVVTVAAALGAMIHAGNLVGKEARLVQAVDELRVQTETLTAQMNARQVDATLQSQLATLRTRLQGRQQAMQWLKSQSAIQETGTSEYLRALARRTLDGVWITSFSWNDEENRLRLEGRALNGDLLPRYLSGLGAEAALQGRAFTRVTLDGASTPAAPVEPGVLAFRLETGKPVEGKSP